MASPRGTHASFSNLFFYIIGFDPKRNNFCVSFFLRFLLKSSQATNKFLSVWADFGSILGRFRAPVWKFWGLLNLPRFRPVPSRPDPNRPVPCLGCLWGVSGVSLGGSGGLWVLLGASGCLWVPLGASGASGSLWGSLGASGCSREPLGASGSFWVPLEASGCFWELLGASACLWEHLGASGCFWVPLGLLEASGSI